MRWEVDQTGSGSCPVASFGISDVEPSACVTRELLSFTCLCIVTKMQDEVMIYWLLINLLKMWQSSNIWKRE